MKTIKQLRVTNFRDILNTTIPLNKKLNIVFSNANDSGWTTLHDLLYLVRETTLHGIDHAARALQYNITPWFHSTNSTQNTTFSPGLDDLDKNYPDTEISMRGEMGKKSVDFYYKITNTSQRTIADTVNDDIKYRIQEESLTIYSHKDTRVQTLSYKLSHGRVNELSQSLQFFLREALDILEEQLMRGNIRIGQSCTIAEHTQPIRPNQTQAHAATLNSGVSNRHNNRHNTIQNVTTHVLYQNLLGAIRDNPLKTLNGQDVFDRVTAWFQFWQAIKQQEQPFLDENGVITVTALNAGNLRLLSEESGQTHSFLAFLAELTRVISLFSEDILNVYHGIVSMRFYDVQHITNSLLPRYNRADNNNTNTDDTHSHNYDGNTPLNILDDSGYNIADLLYHNNTVFNEVRSALLHYLVSAKDGDSVICDIEIDSSDPECPKLVVTILKWQCTHQNSQVFRLLLKGAEHRWHQEFKKQCCNETASLRTVTISREGVKGYIEPHLLQFLVYEVIASQQHTIAILPDFTQGLDAINTRVIFEKFLLSPHQMILNSLNLYLFDAFFAKHVRRDITNSFLITQRNDTGLIKYSPLSKMQRDMLIDGLWSVIDLIFIEGLLPER